MPVDIRDLVVTARLRKKSPPALDKAAVERLKADILAACRDEMAKTIQRLTER